MTNNLFALIIMVLIKYEALRCYQGYIFLLNIESLVYCIMNKPQAYDNMIPVRDYAAQRLSRRGYPVSVQYIYKLIDLHKAGKKSLDFSYIDKGKEGIWIINS